MIKKYYLAILFSLFALFKVALLWSTYHNDILLRSPQSDPKTYWILGMAIRHGDLFQSESLYTSPLYPFIVAVFVSPIGLAIFQMLLGLLATYCLFSIARHYYESEKIGIFSILLGFLYGPLLFYETRLYPTSLTISVTVFAFYLFYFRKESRYWRFIAGLCMAIAVCLTTYMILVMGAFMVTGRRCFRQLSDYAAFCLPLLLMLGFFSWRNYQIDHSFIPLGANMGINLAQGHHPSSDGSYITLPGFDGTKEHQQQQARQLAQQKIPQRLSWKQVDQYWKQQAISEVLVQPSPLWFELNLTLKKLFLFFSDSVISHDIGFRYEQSLIPLLKPLALSFSLLCFLAFLGLTETPWPKGLAAGFLSVLTANLVFYVTERFRLPAAAFLIVPAAAGLMRIFTLPSWRRIVLIVLILTWWGVTLWQPLSRSEQRVGDFNRSLAFAEIGQWDQAEELQRKLFDEKPSSLVGQELMKTLLNQNKSVEAENLGRKLSITYPDHPGILNNLAVSLMRQKRYHEAYPILQRAVDPKIVGQPLPVSINNLEAVTKELERHP